MRFSDLKAVGTANQHMVYFRGAADIARKKQVQMHNRWDLEFDTSVIPCYETLLDFDQKHLAEGAVWTERFRLRDTWEDVVLLCVPVLDQNGVPRGICGVGRNLECEPDPTGGRGTGTGGALGRGRRGNF